ncbi:unnamed protein product, partial [Tetraodon nigroviridis]
PPDVKDVQSVSQNETSITLQWRSISNISSYFLVYNETNNTVPATVENYVIKIISDLTSMTRYNFTLFAVFENIKSSGIKYTAATVPPMVTGVKMTERTTTNVTLVWNVDKWREWTYILYFQGINVTFQANNFSLHKLSGLQPGTEYNFSVVTNFFELNSKAYEGVIVTRVIVGSVTAVLLFGLLICIAVFVYYRRSSIIRLVLVVADRPSNRLTPFVLYHSRSTLFSSGTKKLGKKPKVISAAKFSSHFHRLSQNDNMGFSEEYEVHRNTQQTQFHCL